MGSKQLSADLNFAWPTARIAVIGAEGAAQLLVKRFPDPTAPEVQKIRAEFIEGYNLNMATPWIAAERAGVYVASRCEVFLPPCSCQGPPVVTRWVIAARAAPTLFLYNFLALFI